VRCCNIALQQYVTIIHNLKSYITNYAGRNSNTKILCLTLNRSFCSTFDHQRELVGDDWLDEVVKVTRVDPSLRFSHALQQQPVTLATSNNKRNVHVVLTELNWTVIIPPPKVVAEGIIFYC